MRRHRAVGRLVLLSVVLAGSCQLSVAGTKLTNSYLSPDGRELGLVFDEGIGLRAQAILKLQAGDQSIEILLTNTSYGIPDDPVFDNPSDQILTSLYFDLDQRGLAGGDPVITGGQAWVADGSFGVGGSTLQAGDEISDLWGYANYKYQADGDDPPVFDELPPNFITTMQAHGIPFVGAKLKGPNYGAVSAENLLDAHNAGLPSINDTIRVVITLDQAIPDLASIVDPGNYSPYVEFGSDYEFLVKDEPPPAIPEPLTLIALSLGAAAVGRYVRRRTA
jgi:hypothetical protein